MDGFTGTELASGPFGETFAVAGRGGREVRFRRLASAFAGSDGFAELLLSHRDPVLALGHPHLVTTVAVARDGKGRLIIAEGLPAGPSLDTCLDLVRRGDVHLSRGAALHVARALVSGLAHLHGAGLVHGIVHPRSVYLDPSGVCRLGDVAVAHAVAVAIERAPELRRIADDELAPADPSHPVDARLDVHRAGRLIQMLLRAAGGADSIGRLAEVIDRATAADPRERHADGSELLVHLDEIAGEPGDPEAHQEELARLVADTLAARPLEEEQATSAEHAEIAGEVERLADAEERRQARPAAPTVERPSVSDPDAGLIARARVLPRVPVLLVAAEMAIALFLVIGFMRDPEPAPVPSPAPARAVDLAPAPPPAPAAATAPPARCVLNVRSSPLEATVVIDGLSAGTTPVSVVGVPCETSISVAVEKVGFESVRKKIQLAEGEPFHLQATLRRPKLMLRVASTPAGAQVAIDGEPIGKTPLAIELDASTRAGVLLQMKGYRPYRATVVPSQQRELSAHLIPLRRVNGPARYKPTAARPAKPRARSATQGHK